MSGKYYLFKQDCQVVVKADSREDAQFCANCVFAQNYGADGDPYCCEVYDGEDGLPDDVAVIVANGDGSYMEMTNEEGKDE